MERTPQPVGELGLEGANTLGLLYVDKDIPSLNAHTEKGLSVSL